VLSVKYTCTVELRIPSASMRAGGKTGSTSPFPEPFVGSVATGATTNGAEQVVSDAVEMWSVTVTPSASSDSSG
jgi:hypothetical protein